MTVGAVAPAVLAVPAALAAPPARVEAAATAAPPARAEAVAPVVPPPVASLAPDSAQVQSRSPQQATTPGILAATPLAMRRRLPLPAATAAIWARVRSP